MRQTQSPTLSAHLLREADKFLFYPCRVRRTRLQLGSQKILDNIGRKLIEWRKTFAPKPEDELEETLGTPVFLDEVYCRDLLKAIPDIVERTRSLSRLTLSGVSDSESFAYLREAANCFIFGLPQAAVALARAGLEDALRKKAATIFGKQAVAETELKDLIDRHGVRLLSRKGVSLAHKVRLAGNVVLHQKVTATPDALEVIEAARVVILELAGR